MTYGHWTEEEIKYLRENNGKLPYDQMGINRTPRAIYRKARLLGLKITGITCPICKQNTMSPYAKRECRSCAAIRARSKMGKGRYFLKRDGYVEVSLSAIPEKDWPIVKPMARRGTKGGILRHGKVLEHRYIMAKHLGRPLRDDEVVHHINGVRDDNRIENLKLLHTGNHSAGHGDSYYQKLQEMEIRMARMECLLDSHCPDWEDLI